VYYTDMNTNNSMSAHLDVISMYTVDCNWQVIRLNNESKY
jgi:hypothetical protein